MNNRGWTPPYLLIIIVIIGILMFIFGWKVLIYVVGLFFGITLCVWIYDLVTGGPQEVIEEEDRPVVPGVQDEESEHADAPILLEVKAEEAESCDIPPSEAEPPADDTSGGGEFLGCVVFLGAVLVCLFLPSFALGMWGPWVAIAVSVACGGLWVAFGPSPFPGLLPGCLSIVIPGNALVIILISLYRLIWH